MSSTSALLTQTLPQRITTVAENSMNPLTSSSAPNIQTVTTTQRLIEKATLQAKLAIQLDQEDDILGAAQAYHLTCLTLRQALHLVSQQDYPALVQVYRAHSKRLLYLQGVIQKRKNSGSQGSSKNLQWGRSMSSTPDLRSTVERERRSQDSDYFKATTNDQLTSKSEDSISEELSEKQNSPKQQPLNSPQKLKLNQKPSISDLPGALNPIASPASKKYTIANRNRSGSYVSPTLESVQRPSHTLSKKHSSPALSSFSPSNTSQPSIINPKPVTYQFPMQQTSTSTTSLPSLSNTSNPLPSPTPPKTLRSKTASHLPKLVLHSSYNNLHSMYNQSQDLYTPKTPLPQFTDTTRLLFQSIWNEEMETKQPYHPPPSPNHPIYPLLILQRIQDTMTTGGYVMSKKFYLTPLTWSHPNLKFSNLDHKGDGLDSAVLHLQKFKDQTQALIPAQIIKELDALELNLYTLCTEMSRKIPEINLQTLASTPTGTSHSQRKMSNTQGNSTAQAFFKMASKITKSVEKVQLQFKLSESCPNKGYLEKLYKFLQSIVHLIEIYEQFEGNMQVMKALSKVVQLVHIGFLGFILVDCERAIVKFLGVGSGRPLSLD